jgi:hypothetical protein
MTRIAVARQRTGGEVMTDDARWFVGIDWASETHLIKSAWSMRAAKSSASEDFPTAGPGLPRCVSGYW